MIPLPVYASIDRNLLVPNTKRNSAGIAGIASLETAGFHIISETAETLIVFFHIFFIFW